MRQAPQCLVGDFVLGESSTRIAKGRVGGGRSHCRPYTLLELPLPEFAVLRCDPLRVLFVVPYCNAPVVGCAAVLLICVVRPPC